MLCKVGLPESAALLHAFHVRPESVVATSSACFTCGSVYRSAVFVSSSLATTVLPEVVTFGTTRAFVIAVLHYRKHQVQRRVSSSPPRPLLPAPSIPRHASPAPCVGPACRLKCARAIPLHRVPRHMRIFYCWCSRHKSSDPSRPPLSPAVECRRTHPRAAAGPPPHHLADRHPRARWARRSIAATCGR